MACCSSSTSRASLSFASCLSRAYRFFESASVLHEDLAPRLQDHELRHDEQEDQDAQQTEHQQAEPADHEDRAVVAQREEAFGAEVVDEEEQQAEDEGRLDGHGVDPLVHGLGQPDDAAAGLARVVVVLHQQHESVSVEQQVVEFVDVGVSPDIVEEGLLVGLADEHRCGLTDEEDKFEHVVEDDLDC